VEVGWVDDKSTVIVLTNSANAKPAGIAHTVAGIARGDRK
jgi:hypothetical protein